MSVRSFVVSVNHYPTYDAHLLSNAEIHTEQYVCAVTFNCDHSQILNAQLLS